MYGGKKGLGSAGNDRDFGVWVYIDAIKGGSFFRDALSERGNSRHRGILVVSFAVKPNKFLEFIRTVKTGKTLG
jgi:hypothetical protein